MSVLLTGNGWVHAFPDRSIEIRTGIETAIPAFWSPAPPRLHPNGEWAYYTQAASPNDLLKGDVRSGPFQQLYDSRYHGEFPVCGDLWFTQDRQRIINSCGTVFRTSASQAGDMVFNGGFSATTSVAAAVHSAVLGRIALIPGGRFHFAGVDTDTELQFYDDEFLTFLGKIALPSLSAGVPWHGRYLFQDAAGTKLYVILQPDTRAGASANWGMYALPLGDGANCGATLGMTNATVPALGGSISVNVNAAIDCLWQTTTESNWLVVGTGGVSAGTSTVNITATANRQTSERTATVSIAGRTLTVTQEPSPAGTADPTYRIPFRPVAAEYSKALDRIILVNEAPHALRIVDPVTRIAQTVGLSSTPTSLSVSPDGAFAAVGHDGSVSYVNLLTATLQRVFPVAADAFRVAVSGTHIYVFPRRDQWQPIHVLNIATGVETTWNHIYAGLTGGRISPDGRYLYINGSKRHDIRNGVPLPAFDAITGLCFDTWFTENAAFLLTRCGDVMRLSDTPGQEITYSGRLWEAQTQWVAHSLERKLIAALRSGVEVGADGTEDTVIHLFSDEFITPRATLPIPKQQIGPGLVTMHAQWLFWNNSGTRLYTIMQADASAGISQDYSIYTLSVDVPCGVTLPPPASISAAGRTGTVSVSAPDGCVWFAASTAPWITVVQNGAGTGNASLTYVAEPNYTPATRTGTLQIGGQTFTITQAAGEPPTGLVHVLPFRVTDAGYSSSLDRLIAVGDAPNSLNIYDPAATRNTRVALPLAPRSLALSLDGRRAAVGHDGSITIVNLQSASVEKILPVSIKVQDIALAPNNWVHAAMETGEGAGTAVSVNIASGQETKLDMGYWGAQFALHPNGNSLYSVSSALSPNDVFRFSLTAGPMNYQYDSTYGGPHPLCGPLWFTQDARIVSGCGVVLRTGSTRAGDLIHAGTLSGISGRLLSASHSTERRSIAVLTEPSDAQASELRLYDDQLFAVTNNFLLPSFPVTGATIQSRGRHVFWNSAASRLFVVMQAASGAGLNDFALYSIAPDTGTCPVTLGSTGASIPGAGITGGSIAVMAVAGCAWDAQASSSWITITNGLAGTGAGTITYTVAPNPTTASRTGTITAGGQTFTITQAAGDGTACTPTLSTATLLVQATGGTGRVNLTVGAGCSWTAGSSVPWVQVFPLSGAGSNSVSYTVYPNYTTANRSGTLTIAGRTVQLSQSAATGTENERFVGLMYFNCLGRVPARTEVDFHTRNLGRMSRADTIMNFINSEEFNIAGRFIAGLYVGILGRDAEFGGWLFQRNALVTGWASQETLVPAFLNSAEFQLKYGTLTDPAFVQVLYRNVLGREGSQAEIDYQAGALRSGTRRPQVAQSFLNAAEFRVRTDKRLTAFLLYSVLLLRSITPEELEARVEQMNSGMTPQQLVEAIIQSPEFAALLR